MSFHSFLCPTYYFILLKARRQKSLGSNSARTSPQIVGLGFLILLLDFSNICNLPLKENKISTVPEFVDSFFSGIYKISFICQLSQETNIYYEPFHHITVQLNINLTCRKCTSQSCQSLHTSYQETPNILLIQINRFSVSNLFGH